MEEFDPKDYTLEKRILVIIALFIAACVAIVYFTRSHATPQQVIEDYFDYLSEGRCRRAYNLVLPRTREYYANYRTFPKFKENVCEPVERKYKDVYVKQIDSVIAEKDRIEIFFVLGIQPKLVPNEGTRQMTFLLEKKDGSWYIEGPFLEL